MFKAFVMEQATIDAELGREAQHHMIKKWKKEE
jgi:hypothetical protein